MSTVQTEHPVCTRHQVELIDVGPADWGESVNAHTYLTGWCSIGRHEVREPSWGWLWLPLLPCRQCGGDRPARNATDLGWTCDACGLSIDASEGAKDE